MMNGSSYEELINRFIPKPITSEEQYEMTVGVMNQFIDKGELTPDEQDYLTMLGTLVMAYEDEHYPNEEFELRGKSLLKALMEEDGLRQSDLLQIFKTRSIVSAVLAGKRRLTVDHIDDLAAFFQLPHELFFEARQTLSPDLVPTN